MSNIVTIYGPSGLSDDSVEIIAANTAGSVILSAGTYLIASNMTLSRHVTMLAGAVLQISSGKTVTFNGGFSAPIQPVFSVVANNQVAFSSQFTSVVYPEWWGAKADNSTDNFLPLNCATRSWPNNYDHGVVQLQNGVYRTSDVIELYFTSNCVLQGYIDLARATNTSSICSTSNSHTVVRIVGSNITGYADNNRLRNLTCSRTAMGIAGSKTIEITHNLFAKLENVNANHSQYGIYIIGSGVDLIGVNAATEGSLSGNSVYGVYVDGSVFNSGYMVRDYNYFGGSNTSTTSYGFYDAATAYGAGDRRFNGFNVTGNTNYGLYIVDGGNFSADLAIQNVSMDAIVNEGIHIESPGSGPQQQCNINTGWINITDLGTNNATAIHLINRANMDVSAMNLVCGGTATVQGIVAEGCPNGSIRGVHFTKGSGSITAAVRLKSVSSNPSDGWCLSANTTQYSSPILLDASSNTVVAGNSLGSSTVTIASGSNNNIFNNNITGTITNSGTGNQVNITSPTATSSILGLCKPDNSTITISSGVLTATSGSGGVQTLLSTQTISTPQATIDFTGISGSYDLYQLVITNLKLSTNGAYPVLQISDDNGSTWKTASYDWSYSGLQSNSGTPLASNSTSDSGYMFAGTGGVSSSGAVNATLYLRNLGSSTVTKYFSAESGSYYSGSNDQFFRSGGQYFGSTAIINGIRIKASSGNVSGKLSLIGQ